MNTSDAPLQDDYNHPQKLWYKPPSPVFNVEFLSFRPARCTKQPSEQFQAIFHTLSILNRGDGGVGGGGGLGLRAYFLRKKGIVSQYFVTDCSKILCSIKICLLIYYLKKLISEKQNTKSIIFGSTGKLTSSPGFR